MGKTAKKSPAKKGRGGVKKTAPPKKAETVSFIQSIQHSRVTQGVIRYCTRIYRYLRRNWLGALLIGAATIAFFWPLIIHIGTYSPGGDAMFNAWEMRRNQNCILRQQCPVYTDANIYFPHKDTMLYSETQFSAGAVTLPLYWLSDSPILAYNILTIVLFFLSGYCMYLLAKYLSKGNEYVSVLAGLAFAFAPLRIAAIFHLQNLSIWCLPLAVLCVLMYFERRSKAYLVALFLSLLYVFLASWVQMTFVLATLGALLAGYLVFRQARPKQVGFVAITIALAALTTFPLAKEYLRFSKETKATFSIREQILYSSDLKDYFIPYEGTALGKAYYKVKPHAIHNSYNMDSYSYHSLVLYSVGLFVLISAFLWRKQDKDKQPNFAIVATLAIIALAAFIASLGPVLKVYGHTTYHFAKDLDAAIPMPYILVHKLLPQLAFIRAVGRYSVLVLFVLCCFLALAPHYIERLKVTEKYKRLIYIGIGLLLFIELIPLHTVPMLRLPYTMNWQVPQVYRFIKSNPSIDDIAILNPNYDYPGAPIPIARAEQVLWAGYHNKNIFNGYSGYMPPNYVKDFEDFVDFKADDIPKLKAQRIKYVLVDKGLSSQKPWTNDRVAALLKIRVYNDDRYSLYKVE